MRNSIDYRILHSPKTSMLACVILYVAFLITSSNAQLGGLMLGGGGGGGADSGGSSSSSGGSSSSLGAGLGALSLTG